MRDIGLDKIIKDLDLEIIYKAENIEDVRIAASEINRPGLQLAGYMDKFAYERLQILGNVEWHYCNDLSKDILYNRFEEMFKHPIPALIISRDMEIFPEIIELGQKYNRSIIRTVYPTTKFINILINYLVYER